MDLLTTVSISIPAVPVVLGGLATLLFGYTRSISGVPGLLFHSILPSPDLNLSHFSSERFKALMHSLRGRDFNAVTIDECMDLWGDKKNIILTFDDGLENFYTHALPVLEDAGYKATVFCVAGYLGKKSSWDVYNGSPHLTIEQIKEISALGHQIGSHTLTHANLPFLCARDVTCELEKSKAILEEITGKPVTSLSFPHGSWNMQIWKRAQQAGYKAATLYRNHVYNYNKLFPVYGVYRFDTVNEIISRIIPVNRFSLSIAKARILSHFSRGTPVWKFRNDYSTVM